MADMIIHPTQKWVRLAYTVWFLIAFAVIFLWNNYLPEKSLWPPAGAIAALWVLWPLRLQIRRRFIKLMIEGDKLRFESGIFSRTTRTLQLAKIQDVTVRQRLGQRLMGLGDLSIETAGETSRLTMCDIDHPQEVADQIMDWAREQPSKRKEGRA